MEKTWDFATCMRMEFRIVSRVIHGHDFYEGVRAVIVDKDNKPRWQPARLPTSARRRLSAILRRSGPKNWCCHEANPDRQRRDVRALEPVHEDEAERAVGLWTRRLVLFLRVMAAVSMLKGLYHWSRSHAASALARR